MLFESPLPRYLVSLQVKWRLCYLVTLRAFSAVNSVSQLLIVLGTNSR